MVYKWEPWTQYCDGAVVQYEGHLYKIRQPHQSEPNWMPTATPALWSRLPEEVHEDYHSGNVPHNVEEHHRERSRSPSRPQPGGWGGSDHGSGHGSGHGSDTSDDEKDGKAEGGGEKKGWMTEQRKHQLEIGGGIVGALAIGAGVYAYSKHRSKESEEAKAKAWQKDGSEESWMQGAQARTEHYARGGASPPVRWELHRAGEPFPPNAVAGGREGGHTLYIARGFHENQLLVGKAGAHLNDGRGGCSIGVSGRELTSLEQFEVLVGAQDSFRWVNHNCSEGPLHVSGWQPVEGGRDASGKFVFVVQVQHEGGVHPGRYTDGAPNATIGWGGREVEASEFNVLAYR